MERTQTQDTRQYWKAAIQILNFRQWLFTGGHFRQEHMQVAGKCQSPKNCLQRALTSLTRKLSPPVSLTTYPRCHREQCRELPGQVKCVSQA